MTEWWKREPGVEPDFALVFDEAHVDPADLAWWGGPLIPVVGSDRCRPVYVLPLKGQSVDRWRDLAAIVNVLKDTPAETQERIVALLGA